MNNVTSISIEGKRLPNFQNLKLNQVINDHSCFTIDVDIAELEQQGSHTLENSKDFLGKTLVISFGIESNVEFVGVIDDIALKTKNGHQGIIRLKGKSKTIKLNSLPSNKSWLNKSLEGILRELIEASGVDAQIKTQHKGTIEYTVKYQESNWDFIRRLARTYGESLSYDGILLNFGNTDYIKPIVLEYGKELSKIAVKVKIQPTNYSVFTYNSILDTKYESTAKNDVEGLNELSLVSFDQSLELYKAPAPTHSKTRTHSKSDLENYTAKKQAAKVAELHVIEAQCDVQGLNLGSYINIKSALNLGTEYGYDVKGYGEYKIIEIKHKATGQGVYSAHFKAIPSGITVLPEPNIALPQCSSQIAIVKDNEDPRNMGRVKVQMNWQKYQDTTSWIRVLMPDAGQSDHHAQNRGHVFIPEVGDQVMVGFRHNDPLRPYVMGALFNSTTGAGGGTDNNKKSIITKSGHLIEFNDTPKAESITITDKNKNIIFIDTANKNIKISAPETIDIEAKNINIRAEEKIYMQAQNMETQVGQDKIVGVGNNLEVIAENSYTLKTTEHTETIEGSKTVDIQESLTINTSEAELIASNGDINIQGAGITTVQGGQDVKVSKG